MIFEAFFLTNDELPLHSIWTDYTSNRTWD